jgi:hypothetical protein
METDFIGTGSLILHGGIFKELFSAFQILDRSNSMSLVFQFGFNILFGFSVLVSVFHWEIEFK